MQHIKHLVLTGILWTCFINGSEWVYDLTRYTPENCIINAYLLHEPGSSTVTRWKNGHSTYSVNTLRAVNTYCRDFIDTARNRIINKITQRSFYITFVPHTLLFNEEGYWCSYILYYYDDTSSAPAIRKSDCHTPIGNSDRILLFNEAKHQKSPFIRSTMIPIRGQLTSFFCLPFEKRIIAPLHYRILFDNGSLFDNKTTMLECNFSEGELDENGFFNEKRNSVSLLELDRTFCELLSNINIVYIHSSEKPSAAIETTGISYISSFTELNLQIHTNLITNANYTKLEALLGTKQPLYCPQNPATCSSESCRTYRDEINQILREEHCEYLSKKVEAIYRDKIHNKLLFYKQQFTVDNNMQLEAPNGIVNFFKDNHIESEKDIEIIENVAPYGDPVYLNVDITPANDNERRYLASRYLTYNRHDWVSLSTMYMAPFFRALFHSELGVPTAFATLVACVASPLLTYTLLSSYAHTIIDALPIASAEAFRPWSPPLLTPKHATPYLTYLTYALVNRFKFYISTTLGSYFSVHPLIAQLHGIMPLGMDIAQALFYRHTGKRMISYVFNQGYFSETHYPLRKLWDSWPVQQYREQCQKLSNGTNTIQSS